MWTKFFEREISFVTVIELYMKEWFSVWFILFGFDDFCYISAVSSFVDLEIDAHTLSQVLVQIVLTLAVRPLLLRRYLAKQTRVISRVFQFFVVYRRRFIDWHGDSILL